MSTIARVVITVVICFLSLYAFPKHGVTSNLYADVTNPVSWLLLSVSGEEKTSTMVSCSIGQYLAATVLAENTPERAVREDQSNLILDFLSFGNNTSIENLGIASRLGENFFQYYIFASNIKTNDNSYLVLDLDAPSVFVYGYSWLFNLPAKFFTQIGIISELTKHEGTFVSIIAYIDPLVNLLSLFVELPLALFNTMIGFILAFILNPIDSLCSILPSIYFLIKTTIIAVINIF